MLGDLIMSMSTRPEDRGNHPKETIDEEIELRHLLRALD